MHSKKSQASTRSSRGGGIKKNLLRGHTAGRRQPERRSRAAGLHSLGGDHRTGAEEGGNPGEARHTEGSANRNFGLPKTALLAVRLVRG